MFIMAKIGLELASRGHEFILVTADLDTPYALSRTQGSSIKVASYDPGFNKTGMENLVVRCTEQSPLECTVSITENCNNACRQLLLSKDLIATISDAHVVLADMAHPCGYIFTDLYSIPIRVDVSPVGFYDPWGAMHWGIPSPASYVPQLGSKLTNKMNFGERLTNTIVQGALYAITPTLDKLTDNLRKEFNVTKSHTASARSSGMYLLNVDWATEFPRPITPVAKVVGPILPEPAKALPAELEAWMTAAPNGVLLVSLGTVAEAVLTPETINTLAEVFGQLPLNVLWKLGRAKPTTLAANIKLMSWFPQNDLLGHPATKAFFTHGGMNSVQEAAYHGVPMLGFPLFADQFDNVVRMVAAGCALEVRQEQFEAEFLKKSILKLLETPSYKEAAVAVAKRMSDRKNTPAQESADWVEYCIRNNNCQHLRVPVLDMSFVQAENLDVLATFVALALIIVFVVFALLKKLIGRDNTLALLALTVAYLVYSRS